MGKYFSRGKLLLTSEYAVLDGALALAVPTKLGQEFSFIQCPEQEYIIYWQAKHLDKDWLNITIDYKNWKILETNISDSAQFVLKTLKNIYSLNSFRFDGSTYQITTNLQFPSNYGLGSSSTLMNNLAEWAEVDAFRLNDLSLGGSGYDIAVAKENSPIFFQINNSEREFHKVDFNPSFKDELILVHLNQKQDSREGISLYKSKPKSLELISQLSTITKEVSEASSLDKFSDLMTYHEQLISEFLKKDTVKDILFSDCPTFVKSLGAWGGDFVLSRKFGDYEKYFFDKGFTVFHGYKELIC